jgi:hypothetical protein
MSKKPRIAVQSYSGTNLDRLAFPLGGIGAGMIALEGSGAIGRVSLRHKPDVFHEPRFFAALYVAGAPQARVLQGPVPAWRTVTNEPPAYPVAPVGIQLREVPADTEYRYEYASDTDEIGRPVGTGTPPASAGR